MAEQPATPQVFTKFTPPVPNNPMTPDFVSEGKIMENVAVVKATTEVSKSAKVSSHPGQYPLKTIYVEASNGGVAGTAVGSFVIEVLLDEREISGGNPVWRKLAVPVVIAVVNGAVSSYTFTDLFRQVRVAFTAGAVTDAVANAWIFSIA